jgi:uncharacterized membrane protein YadS
VGAGFSMSDETGEIATLVKIIRVSLLAPTIITTSILVTVLGAGVGQKSRNLNRLIPGFVLGLALSPPSNHWDFCRRQSLTLLPIFRAGRC